MPPILAAADFRGIAFFLPALPCQRFPLEGFDFVGPSLSPGFSPAFSFWSGAPDGAD